MCILSHYIRAANKANIIEINILKAISAVLALRIISGNAVRQVFDIILSYKPNTTYYIYVRIMIKPQFNDLFCSKLCNYI